MCGDGGGRGHLRCVQARARGERDVVAVRRLRAFVSCGMLGRVGGRACRPAGGVGLSVVRPGERRGHKGCGWLVVGPAVSRGKFLLERSSAPIQTLLGSEFLGQLTEAGIPLPFDANMGHPRPGERFAPLLLLPPEPCLPCEVRFPSAGGAECR